MIFENERIIIQLQRIINKILFMKKRKFFQFRGINLYPSEIHLMLVIDEIYDTNATKIAHRLSVTKGAVSQSLSRLEKKGVLLKKKDPYNKNELEMTFTELGKKALSYYKIEVAAIFKQHDHFLSGLTTKEKTIVEQFMSQIEQMMDQIVLIDRKG